MQFKDGNIQNTMSLRKYCSFYIIEVSGPRTDRDDMKKKRQVSRSLLIGGKYCGGPNS